MDATGRGPLIAIEGIDGAGTTTQAARLVAWLAASGWRAHLTREPSTGPVGTLLRAMLGGQHAPVDAGAVALLFAADRLDHLAREIEPPCAAGAVVVTDRYVLSSLAYQSLTVPRDFVAAINRRARPPDLTLFVDVPVEVAAARRQARGGPEELFDALDVQRRVAGAYRAEAERARAAGERITIVDGRPDAEAVFTSLREAITAARVLPPPLPHPA